MSGFLDELPESFQQQRKRKKTRPKIPDVVIWHVIRCPKCKSEKVPVQRTKVEDGFTIRYHKCQKCGFCFKSVEK